LSLHIIPLQFDGENIADFLFMQIISLTTQATEADLFEAEAIARVKVAHSLGMYEIEVERVSEYGRFEVTVRAFDDALRDPLYELMAMFTIDHLDLDILAHCHEGTVAISLPFAARNQLVVEPDYTEE